VRPAAPSTEHGNRDVRELVTERLERELPARGDEYRRQPDEEAARNSAPERATETWAPFNGQLFVEPGDTPPCQPRAGVLTENCQAPVSGGHAPTLSQSLRRHLFATEGAREECA
jgi:hypothetical protein